MNEDQMDGIVKNIPGTAQESTGGALGRKDQHIKGLDKRENGQAEKFLGDIQEAAHDDRTSAKLHFRI